MRNYAPIPPIAPAGGVGGVGGAAATPSSLFLFPLPPPPQSLKISEKLSQADTGWQKTSGTDSVTQWVLMGPTKKKINTFFWRVESNVHF